MDDRTMFETFREYGAKALQYRQKCIGMLPEIYRRQIHLKQGFDSIFEFAAKFAGLSHEQVKRVLSLDEHFGDKPALKYILEKGEVSINKLARIASIATVENQEELAAMSRTLSKNALETLARDIRQGHKAVVKSDFVPGHKYSLKLKEEVERRLYELQEKGIDINELILAALDSI